MEANTKYSIGDTVYICVDCKIRKCGIACVNLVINKDFERSEYYYVDDVNNGSTFRKDVSELFDTIDDLVKSFNL